MWLQQKTASLRGFDMEGQKRDPGPFGPGANPLESSARGSIYESGCDALHRVYARARALYRCDHEDGYAYLRYGNTWLSPPYQVFFANLAIYSLLRTISELNNRFL